MRKFLFLLITLTFLLPNPAAAQDVKALVDRGLDHSQKGNYDQALKDFDQALQAKPGDAAILTSRGVVYYAKGQNDRAIQDFDQAIKSDPNFGRAYYQRAKVYVTLNLYDKALKNLMQAKSAGFKVDEDFIDMVKGKAAEQR